VLFSYLFIYGCIGSRVSRSYSLLLCSDFSLQGFSCYSSQALEQEPGPGIEPMFLSMQGGFLTSEPPGKSYIMFYYWVIILENISSCVSLVSSPMNLNCNSTKIFFHICENKVHKLQMRQNYTWQRWKSN